MTGGREEIILPHSLKYHFLHFEMITKKCLYREVYDYVLGLVVNGEHPADGRLPTESQLCERFQTSRATVTKAMKKLEHSGVIRRQAGAGSFALKSTEPKIAYAALLIASLGDTEFFSPICAQIAKSCQKHNISLIWGNTGPATEITKRSDIDQICRRLTDQQVTGVFFAPNQLCETGSVDNERDVYLAESLARAGIAIVLIDRDITLYPERSRFDFVGIDNVHSAFLQTKHLYEQGCRKIIAVTKPIRVTTREARLAGYKIAMEHFGLGFRPEWIHVGDASDVDFVRKTLKCDPDGVVCFNDPVAMSYLHKLLLMGIDVPKELKVIGIDDLEYAKYMPVPLSTMQQPCKEIGDMAVATMIRRLENPMQPPMELLLSTTLLARASTIGFENNNGKAKVKKTPQKQKDKRRKKVAP